MVCFVNVESVDRTIYDCGTPGHVLEPVSNGDV
jgi:hypothetical protein